MKFYRGYPKWAFNLIVGPFQLWVYRRDEEMSMESGIGDFAILPQRSLHPHSFGAYIHLPELVSVFWQFYPGLERKFYNNKRAAK